MVDNPNDEPDEWEELMADEGYWEKLMSFLRDLPDAVEADGEDPEPFV